MKQELRLNPSVKGGKRYNLIIRGDYTKKEISDSLKRILNFKIKITSLNRKDFKQFYLNFPQIQEEKLILLWDFMRKELIKEKFDPVLFEKNKLIFIKNLH